jgi:hypothetical protein
MVSKYGKKLGIESGPKARAGGLCPPQTNTFFFFSASVWVSLKNLFHNHN